MCRWRSGGQAHSSAFPCKAARLSQVGLISSVRNSALLSMITALHPSTQDIEHGATSGFAHAVLRDHVKLEPTLLNYMLTGCYAAVPMQSAWRKPEASNAGTACQTLMHALHCLWPDIWITISFGDQQMVHSLGSCTYLLCM